MIPLFYSRVAVCLFCFWLCACAAEGDVAAAECQEDMSVLQTRQHVDKVSEVLTTATATVGRRPEVAQVTPGGLPRLAVIGDKLYRNVNGVEEEVMAMGANYVVKGHPYFPPPDIVRRNAQYFKAAAASITWQPPNGAKVVPVVRLGTMMEAGMPDGPEISAEWDAHLNETINIFAEEGVYVVLDIHQDGFASSNGGEGLPVWLIQRMEADRHDWPSQWYTATPKQPLSTIVCNELWNKLAELGADLIPTVQLAVTENPWHNFSVGSDAGDPRRMNIGNRNMAENNNDGAWSRGVLLFTNQVQNIGERFYESPFHPHDRKNIFNPYVKFVRHLTKVWQRNANVLCIELLNEPPLGGLPDLLKAAGARRTLFSFYSQVLHKLDDSPAIIAFEDLFGSVPEAGDLDVAVGILPLTRGAQKNIQARAAQGQLMFAFHYYTFDLGTKLSFSEQIQRAKESFPGMPVFLSEFYEGTAEETAALMIEAGNSNVSAVTYWHFVDRNFTNNSGWFIYPPEVQNAGGPSNAWEAWQEVVRSGNSWGAQITGSGGGKTNVLDLMR